ncbi:MAG: hypothetical protein IJS28_11235 [Synergistaceae bacterium]|nr:hypothetical protein [Synergistaceae bacterium]
MLGRQTWELGHHLLHQGERTSSETQPDIPDGIIISEPYYEWHKFIHIRKAPPKAETSRRDILNSILNLYRTER